MNLIDWIRNPKVYLTTVGGQAMIPQSSGILENWSFDVNFNTPVIFTCADTVTGNIDVVYWNGSSEIIDCLLLRERQILIKRINSANTTVSKSDIRLEI